MLSALPLRIGMTGTLVLGQHFCRQIRLLFDKIFRELWTLAKLVADNFVHSNQLPLLQVVENLGIGVCASALYCLNLFPRRISYRRPLSSHQPSIL